MDTQAIRVKSLFHFSAICSHFSFLSPSVSSYALSFALGKELDLRMYVSASESCMSSFYSWVNMSSCSNVWLLDFFLCLGIETLGSLEISTGVPFLFSDVLALYSRTLFALFALQMHIVLLSMLGHWCVKVIFHLDIEKLHLSFSPICPRDLWLQALLL